MMHGHEKSDPEIVAIRTNAGGMRREKPTNKAVPPAAELVVQRRAGTKGNAGQQSTLRAQDRAGVSQALDRIRQAARHNKKKRFTALLHHVNPETLRLAFNALKKDAAPGVDGTAWSDYEVDLERRLEELHDRVHRGAYRPQPSRRVYIPKANGRQRLRPAEANRTIRARFKSRCNVTGERQHASSTLRSFLQRWTSLASGIIPVLNHDSRSKKSGY
jgi:hypothetical protein